MQIDWAGFAALNSLAGGALIGAAAVLMVLWGARIAGISGIVGGLLKLEAGDMAWRWCFVAGLLLAPYVFQLFAPLPEIQIEASPATLIVAGVLVGFGSRLGSGCTSGHGVCGVSRGSWRSIVATVSFMLMGMLVVYVVRHG